MLVLIPLTRGDMRIVKIKIIKEDRFFKTNKEIKTAEFFVKLHNLLKLRSWRSRVQASPVALIF